MAAYLVQSDDGSVCIAVEAETQEDAVKQAFPGAESLPKGMSVTNVSPGSDAPAVVAKVPVIPAPPPTKNELA